MNHVPVSSKYFIAHKWIYKNYKKTGVCELCGKYVKTEWSNKSGDYRQERDDWQELCHKCHSWYDGQPYMRGASFRAGAFKVPGIQIIGTSSDELEVLLRFKRFATGHSTYVKALSHLMDLANI